MLTCTCSIASIEIGATPVRSPGWPPRPNELLNAAPFTVMLFMRLSAPPNELVPEVCGVNRVNDSMRPAMVGSVASTSRFTAVAAPVRVELNTVSDCAVTVTVSVTAISLTLTLMSVETPRLISIFSTVSGAKAAPPEPVYATVTEYGPPTRMLRMTNRPSFRVVVSYVVPDGRWIAMTLAPETPSCFAFCTTPASDPVVTCAVAGNASESAAITDKAKRKTIFIRILLLVSWKLSPGDDVRVKEKTGQCNDCTGPSANRSAA